MTSRVTECKQYSTDAFEALGGLEEEDAKELLLKATGLAPGSWLAYDNQAREVARLLGLHALALIQAGAYISQGHCQLYQYPGVYQRQRQRLLKYRPKQAQSRYRDVYATFEASADVLEQSQTESARDALRLLEILSMFDSSVLPFQIFEEAWKGCREISQARDKDRGIDEFSRYHVLQLPELMVPDEDEWDHFRLTEASALLVSLSLATRQDLNSCVGLSMHPLTHAWAKDRQDSRRQGVAWIATGCVLGFSRSNTRMWRTQERRLLPHVLSYLDLKVKKAFDLASKTVITSILLKCGEALRDMRQDTRLGQLLQDMFLELRQKPDKPSEDLLPLYDLQARSLIDLGRNEAARELLEQVIRIRETTQPKTHPSTLGTMSALALVLTKQGKYADAEAMDRQTLEIREEVLGKIHPDTLITIGNLALILEKQGKYTDAEAMNRQTLEIREEVLGKMHPDTLITMGNLALVLSKQGKYADAEAMNRQTLEIREEILGKIHPDTLMTMNNLAVVLVSQGKYTDAEAMNRQTLEIREEVLGKMHPDTLMTMGNLATILEKQGKYTDAEVIFRQTFEIIETVLGKTHPDTLRIMGNLAIVLKKQGKYADAEAMNRQTLEIREEVLGRMHPSTLTTMSNLAGVLDSQGKYTDAEAMNRQTLEIREEVLGKMHPDTLITMNNLAAILEKQGKYTDAEVIFRQTFEIREEVLGKTHPDTLTSIYYLAYVLEMKQEYKEASLLYQRACTGYNLSLGSEHPTTKACVKHYSSMLRRLKKSNGI
jgi:tetratricopeptide (TPR) repeat protein